MKKQIKLFILFGIVLFTCSACNGDITRDIRHDGFAVGDEFICDVFYPKDKEDTSYTKIKYFTGSQIIDETGKIYEVVLGRTYENKQNCKMADTALKVVSIFDNKIFKAEDNKYYYLEGQNNVSAYSMVPESDNNYYIYNLLLSDKDVIKAVTANSSTGSYYVLKADGNIYDYTITRADRNSPAVISSKFIKYNKNDFRAQIIDFNYAGDESLATFVRTTETVFRNKVTNADECSKYADRKCDFKIIESEVFAKHKDKIITFNGSTLITTYKRMFTVSN